MRHPRHVYSLGMRGVSLIALSLLAACSAPSADAPAAEAPAAEASPVRRVEYRGTIDLEAHLARPGDTIPLELTWAQTCSAEACLVERTTGSGDGANTVRIWSTSDAAWVEGSGVRMLADDASNHRRVTELVSPADGAPKTEIPIAHPRLGNVTDTAIYGTLGPDGVPESVTLDVHDSDIAWRGTLELGSVGPAGGLEVPPAPAAAEAVPASITKLADGLWDARVPAKDARSFVVEFDSFLVVIEAPWSSAVGEEIVDLIDGALSKKPIRYVLYSHHHPHYTGGLRAFMASGASVLAPSVHRDFVESIAALDFSRSPDRYAKHGEAASVIAFDETFTIAEAGRSIQVIDIGEQSNHTAAYMVVWLPDSKTLIQGDIGWFTDPSGELLVGARSAGLLRAVDERGLDVQTLVQSWPVNGQAPTLEMSRFRAAVSTAGR